jgi:tetratricopeptide (TPR) repeat protein
MVCGAVGGPRFPDVEGGSCGGAPHRRRDRNVSRQEGRRQMKPWAILLVSMMLAACATAPPSPQTTARLFSDSEFAPPSVHIGAENIFALNDAMKRYLRTDIAKQLQIHGRQRGLIAALYNENQLKLDFDSTTTRTAAQAFDARSGNCLSLVIMTAAFAKELGLTVRYQKVHVDETWSRSGDNYLLIGHVNLSLGERRPESGHIVPDALTIDFLSPQDVSALHSKDITEDTIVAMYFNNRAVESLTQGQLDDAYWWARAAIRTEPEFLSAFNTLGAVYQRHGDFARAEQAFAYVLDREPSNTHVMSNLALVYSELGRADEARALSAKLAQLQPEPPFSFFKRGMAALKQGNYGAAREWFAKEVERAPYYHEFQFWLAVACAGLGDAEGAREHLTIALENSTTRSERELYAAKLGRISGDRRQ